MQDIDLKGSTPMSKTVASLLKFVWCLVRLMRYWPSKYQEHCYYNKAVLHKLTKEIKITAPGGVRTRDLRITSAPSAAIASTAYKYDALTDCATGAGCRTEGPYVDVIVSGLYFAISSDLSNTLTCQILMKIV